MDHEIQLISDGDGLAVMGNPTAVARFLVSEGLPSKDLALQRLRPALGNAAVVAQAASDVAANSGGWVKLTKESAQRADKYGLRESATTGLSTGVLKGDSGQIKGFLEFAKRSGPLRTNPARLANVAAAMAQLAMQQTMDEITEMTATVSEPVAPDTDGAFRVALPADEPAQLHRGCAVGQDVDQCVATPSPSTSCVGSRLVERAATRRA
ncbi:hypothetical protein ACGF0K_21660 [Streptomyces sp. NPDC048156]|uniref:hypothetical protein n=1 Tax=Streptomyces sp. NPDC048156 TaxID=3365502 RepID=UPI00371DB5EF